MISVEDEVISDRDLRGISIYLSIYLSNTCSSWVSYDYLLTSAVFGQFQGINPPIFGVS